MSMTPEFYADAKEWLTNARALAADYAADVDHWYRAGDGRSTRDGGRGYAYPYCQHGASLWVDHDIPCGRCESGEDDDIYAAALAYARRKAREREAKVAATVDAVGALQALCVALRAMGASEADVAAVSVPVAKAIGQAAK